MKKRRIKEKKKPTTGNKGERFSSELMVIDHPRERVVVPFMREELAKKTRASRLPC